ncbi:hypothetical protein L6164_007027 [Bauhinia variegata]|uniref:Uncharacterized protein n=1 Tax=Bauhinia variegata TaxID=167791 RepID=A0ACB9PXR7_BAUVA|nr:hypothetical protein L6164_007027 [Bauhinia variegata]
MMRRSNLRGIGQRCFLLFWEKKTLSDAGVLLETSLRAKQLECPPSVRYYHQITKTKHQKISHPSFEPFSSPSFSSLNSSSSSSKMGIIDWYLRKLESHPVLTKSISSSFIFIAADLTSQMITLEPSGSFDLKRILRMAMYGLLILGPAQHMWFNFMSKVLPKRDVASTLKKILMGQAIFGPTVNSVFFSYNAALQGESGPEIVARLKRDLIPTLLRGAIYWPICDFLTFKFLAVHLQPLANSSFAYIWTIYLTYMANLKGVRTA